MSYSPAAAEVKQLRDATGAGMMDCKRALADSEGDFERAVDLLREKGLASVAKRAGRSANQGLVDAYVHFNNTVGVLVEVNCETDFVANTDDFRQLVKDIALHIASPSAPRFLARDEVPTTELDDVRRIATVQAEEAGKPENVIARIVEGKTDAYLADIVLLEQPFVKDSAMSVGKYAESKGMKVKKFVHWELGKG